MDVTLQTTLSNILQSLADFFGMTTQAIMENAPYWLARYGWYLQLDNITTGAIVTSICFGVVLTIYGGAYFIFWIDSDCDTEKMSKFSRSLIKYVIFGYLIIICIICIVNLIPCFIAPEMVGIKGLISLISN